ncbi:bifunctional lysylphosphatidylglycerol flippase/synthetase MprF [Amycolatopsis sp. Poz14]|uniref:bifunctional lysylphosphatidylglycerol flippase/synthetase MprF n=1 Tax=Amycolatopsis sp. Poz14 TaxID=1447705 RepID=UPI001EE8E58B|nr:DUF2156 domain-containing protein [Amycolatopsis sp. Poz14]MCG3752608.1 DUF2156 domain-containing protein [Amycolatopsis sp. Poz14]
MNRLGKTLAWPARQLPFTTGFLVLFWTVGLLSDSVLTGPDARVGVGVDTAVTGAWWAPFTSMLWAGDLGSYLGASIVVALLCGLAEQSVGTLRTAVLFVTTHVAGAVIAVSAITVGAALGNSWAMDLSSASVVTPTAAAMGTAAAASWRMKSPWGARIRLALVLTTVLCLLYAGFAQDAIRLCAVGSGLVLGWFLAGPAREKTVRNRTESRLVVAMVLAASAAGPLIATVTQTAEGPLSVLQFLMTAPTPDLEAVAQTCAEPGPASACRQLRATLRMSGAGPAFLSILPVLLMLVMAEGLRRGRRFAWWSALCLNLALAVLGVLLLRWYLAYDSDTGEPPARMTLHDWLETSVPLLQPFLVIGVLVATRRWFRVAAPRRTYRRFATVTGVTFAVCSTAYVAALYTTGAVFDPMPSFSQVLLDLPMRYLPPGYLEAFPIEFVPVDNAALFLYRWTGPLFWGVVLLGCMATFVHARVARRASDRTRAKELLRRYGGGTMSHMITWRGNDYWFDDAGPTVIAYRVIGGVALTTSEPVGPPDSHASSIEKFVEFCAENGWTPCFYAVSDAMRERLPDWKAVQVAEEAVVPLSDLVFRGKKWQDVRSALNKAGKLGVTAKFADYPGTDEQLAAQIESVSQAWVSGKGMPEMRFTLGTLRELTEPDVRCLVAVDSSGAVHGVTSWLPVYREGAIVAWTLDVMRRAPQAFPGVMEFLIASMALRAKEEGAAFLSLSGAPLANRDPEVRGALEKLLDLTGRAIEPIYGFRSLLAFKAKFQPAYQPLYLVYPAVTALPGIGNAVARAYLPNATAAQYLRLARGLLGRTRS